MFEERLNDDGVIVQTNVYQPREIPKDPLSAPLDIVISRLTGTGVINKRLKIKLWKCN